MGSDFRKMLKEVDSFNQEPSFSLEKQIIKRVEKEVSLREKRNFFISRFFLAGSLLAVPVTLFNLMDAWGRSGLNDFLRLFFYDWKVILKNSAVFSSSLLEAFPGASVAVFLFSLLVLFLSFGFMESFGRKNKLAVL
jgi:hypothetical protein